MVPDGRPFLAVHCYDSPEYQEKITKYLLQQGVITNGNVFCDCM